MRKIAMAVAGFILIAGAAKAGECQMVQVTGYYTPNLSDYSATHGALITVAMLDGSHSTFLLNASFVKDVQIKMEGEIFKGHPIFVSFWNGVWSEIETPKDKEHLAYEPYYNGEWQITLQMGDENYRDYTLPGAFITEVGVEGWGQLDRNFYLGYWAERPGGPWYTSAQPLGSNNNILETGSAATDPAVIPYGTKFRIKDLPGKYGEIEFTAADVGPAIVGAHVDIYTGEGREALRDAYAITGSYEACW